MNNQKNENNKSEYDGNLKLQWVYLNPVEIVVRWRRALDINRGSEAIA